MTLGPIWRRQTTRDGLRSTLLLRIARPPAVVTTLLRAGANLAATDSEGGTPLHGAAAFSQTPAVVTTLLRAGANLAATDSEGWTPLHWAAADSQTPAVVTALLNAGANLAATDSEGWTPLHAAAAHSQTPAVVTALLDAGANSKAKAKSLLSFIPGFSTSPWDLAKDNTALHGTEVYERLHEAHLK